MFAKSHEFTIEGGTFNEAQTQHFYNITIICDKTTQSVEDHEKHWRTLITAVDPIVETNKGSNGIVSADTRYLHWWSWSESKNEDPEDEDTETDDVKPPVRKHLVFYTGVDKASKKLKRSTEVLVFRSYYNNGSF